MKIPKAEDLLNEVLSSTKQEKIFIDHCKLEPIGLSDKDCFTKEDVDKAKVLALNTVDAFLEANKIQVGSTKDNSCSTDLISKIQTYNQKIRDDNTRFSNIQTKLKSNHSQLYSKLSQLSFWSYYYAYKKSGKKTITAFTVFDSSKLLNGETSLGVAKANTNYDDISIYNELYTNSLPDKEFYSAIQSELVLQKFDPKSLVSKSLLATTEFQLSEMKDIGKILSLSEFVGGKFDEIGQFSDNFLKEIEDQKFKYKKDIEDKISIYNAEIKRISDSLVYGLIPTTAITQQQAAFDLYNKDISTINSAYSEKANTAIDTTFTSLKELYPEYQLDISEWAIADGFLDIVYTTSGSSSSPSGIVKMFNDISNTTLNVNAIQNGESIQSTLNAIDSVLSNTFIHSFRQNDLLIKYLANKISDFSQEEILKENFLDIFKATVKDINDILTDMVFYWDYYDLEIRKKKITEDISAMEVCGSKIGDESSSGSGSEPEDDSNFLKLKYWLQYSAPLNIVSALPSNWTVGLITSAGNQLMPIVWIPIAVFNVSSKLIVIFITINGIVVCPVIYETSFDKSAQTPSTLKTLFRGANSQIKSGTAVEKAAIPVVNGIDTDPKLSEALPFTTDDLPTLDRVNPTNPLLLSYLQKWMDAAKPYMGLS